jgi:hypothetical protein
VNAVHLLGHVGARPQMEVARQRCALLLTTLDVARHTPERHRVIANGRHAAIASQLCVGQAVYVAGRLQRERSYVVVVAVALWPIGETPSPPNGAVVRGTHASPCVHERSGHWRRVGIGSAGEHLVWVRSTIVGRDRKRAGVRSIETSASVSAQAPRYQ